MRRLIGATTVLVVGLAVISSVPTAYEGPSLLYINEQPAIRLVDAIGLAVAVPSWLYLNLCALHL